MMSKNIIKSLAVAGLMTLVVFGLTTTMAFAQPTTQPTTQVVTPAEASKLEGTTNGADFGKFDGAEAGKKDYHLGRVSNPNIASLTDAVLIERYGLSKENLIYRTEFLASYRLSYEIAYNTAFREASYEAKVLSSELGYEHGEKMAIPEANYMAMLDLMRNRDNNWGRAYNEYLAQGTLDARFQLQREVPAYRDAFYTSFKAAFETAYIESFSNLNILTETQNLNYHLINFKEDSIKVDQVYGELVAGAPGTVSNSAAYLKFARGTLYQETYIGMHHVQNSFGLNAKDKEPVTHQVRVSIGSSTGKVKFNKPVELAFDYDGTNRAGIYEWKFNRWIYVPTVQTETQLVATLPVGEYAGGTYMVLIDNAYTLPFDITLHWAYKDIVTAARKEYLPTGNLFRPGDAITRAELAQMIYKILNYRVLTPGRQFTYADSTLVSSGDLKAVNFVLDRSIMSLDAKQRFNPKAPVSFKDFEQVMKRILFVEFKYQPVAEALKTERFWRSGFLKGITQPITRAEVVYVFNQSIK